jgi:hypothetical protein
VPNNPVTLTFSLATPSANGIALNQTLGSAANLSFAGGSLTATATSGAITATFDVARRVGITSAGNDAALNWVVVGTDRNGNPQTDTFAGSSSAQSTSRMDFLTVTRISATSSTAAGVVAGSNGTGSTPWFPREFSSYGTLAVAIQMATAPASTGSFELTWDDVNAQQAVSLSPWPSVNPQSNIPPVAWPASGLTGINQTTQQEISTTHMFWRWTTTTGTTATIVQVIETLPGDIKY